MSRIMAISCLTDAAYARGQIRILAVETYDRVPPRETDLKARAGGIVDVWPALLVRQRGADKPIARRTDFISRCY